MTQWIIKPMQLITNRLESDILESNMIFLKKDMVLDFISWSSWWKTCYSILYLSI